jgi:hypothetical protein
MKKTILFVLLMIVSLQLLTAQESNLNKNPVGLWKYEAPGSEPGFDSGIAEISFADGKYSATLVFTGTEYKFPAYLAKFENDTLLININVNNADFKATLKFIEASKMVGKAVSSEAEFQVVLTKITSTGVK